MGSLSLNFTFSTPAGRTILSQCRQQAPLRVIRAFEVGEGGALVHMHNLSGGVLGGDTLSLNVEVGAGAYAQLTTTSATRVYRSQPYAPVATQTNRVHVNEGALLEYVPDPLIPFAGARYRQQTLIELAGDAGLFWWEIVAPGRIARGECFDYEMLSLDIDIIALGRPILIERVRLEPRAHRLESPVRMGMYHYSGSFFICRAGLERVQWLRLEDELSSLARTLSRRNEVMWGVSTLAAHGLQVRVLSCRGEAIASGLYAFWRTARQALYGREVLPPRKVY